MATARGQIQITDLNDARQTSFYLALNPKSRTQVYNKSGMTYSPNYVTTNMVITPTLYVTGDTDNKMFSASAAPVWTVYDNDTKIFCNSSDTSLAMTNSNIAVGTAAPWALTIKMNIPRDQFVITCETSWYDSSIGKSIPQTADVTLTKNINNGTLAYADIWASGNTFLNKTTPASITLTPVLDRGGDDDTTPAGGTDGAFDAVWYKNGTADSNKITATANKYAIDSTTKVLTVYPDGVDSVDTFWVKVTDKLTTSATYNKSYYSSTSITDLTDPYEVRILSSNGTSFKNGKGDNKILTAYLKQGANDVTSKAAASFAWKVVDNSGKEVNLPDGTVTNEQTFTVTPAMISGTAMVECAITLK